MRLSEAMTVGKALASVTGQSKAPGARDAGVVARAAGAIYGSAMGFTYGGVGVPVGAAMGAHSFARAGLLGGARQMQHSLQSFPGEEVGGLTQAVRAVVNAKRAGTIA